MKLILPLEYVHPLKTKKDKHVKYSLNDFLADLSDKSWHTKDKNKRKPNHAYQRFAKKYLQDIVKEQVKDLAPLEGVWPKKVILTIYRKTNHAMDVIDNPAILIKYAMDVVKIDHVPDDNFNYFSSSLMQDGGLDRKNPRAELEIVDI